MITSKEDLEKELEHYLTLKELRIKRNIQKKYVCEKLRISPQGYTPKEDGDRQFDVSELEILCSIFNKSYKDMITIIKNTKKE